MACTPPNLNTAGCPNFRTQALQGMVDRGGVYVTIFNSIPCTGTNVYVNNELYQFDYTLNGDNSIILTGATSLIGAQTDWTSTSVNTISGSIVVTDASGASGYTENVDYSVNYSTATITRLLTGNIQDLDIVEVTYSWHFDCIDEKTGNPNRFCETCKDSEQGNAATGVIYYKSTTMKALFHIPNYDSPFEKSGVWKLGDGVITTTSAVDINAVNHTDGGFFCQDKIKIIGQPGIWKVMSMPQTIQMGQYLGKRIHCRKIDY